MSSSENKLCRVKITERCYCPVLASGVAVAMPTIDSVKKNGNVGTIPPGTKGYIVKKFGGKYFRPDEDQDGIDLFTPANQPIVLIPYRIINGKYEVIPENE